MPSGPKRDGRGTTLERFWRKVNKTDSCWLWTDHKDRAGYGRFGVDHQQNRNMLAHVFSYLIHKGPVPEDRELDHTCRNPGCVNPNHLEPVTHRENILRGQNPAAVHAAQTHCLRGHPFSPGNVAFTKTKTRICKTCSREARHRRAIEKGNHQTVMIPGERSVFKDIRHGRVQMVWFRHYKCPNCGRQTKLIENTMSKRIAVCLDGITKMVKTAERSNS